MTSDRPTDERLLLACLDPDRRRAAERTCTMSASPNESRERSAAPASARSRSMPAMAEPEMAMRCGVAPNWETAITISAAEVPSVMGEKRTEILADAFAGTSPRSGETTYVETGCAIALGFTGRCAAKHASMLFPSERRG